MMTKQEHLTKAAETLVKAEETAVSNPSVRGALALVSMAHCLMIAALDVPESYLGE